MFCHVALCQTGCCHFPLTQIVCVCVFVCEHLVFVSVYLYAVCIHVFSYDCVRARACVCVWLGLHPCCLLWLTEQETSNLSALWSIHTHTHTHTHTRSQKHSLLCFSPVSFYPRIKLLALHRFDSFFHLHMLTFTDFHLSGPQLCFCHTHSDSH